MALGDICRCCNKGKLYKGESRKLLQFTGNAPVAVKKHNKEVLRCNCCGHEFMSNQNIHKWDHTARSSIVLQKVQGMPFYRLSKLQSLYNTPIAPSTLWTQCSGLWNDCGLDIYKQLLNFAGDSNIFYLDDTRAKILTVIKANKELPINQRRSCNTTTICTQINNGYNIILYITDNKYCGENFAPLLTNRSNNNHYVRLVVDASNRNIPCVDREILDKVIIANCFAHGRRKFHELLEYYPDECRYFLRQIGSIYKIDEECRNYSSRKRLKYHKQHSSKYIKNIYSKINYLLGQKLIEPNSALGKGMNYWVNNKAGLTRFLKVKGIELDNNKAERALKGIILQRKNSLFYNSQNSAIVLSGLSSIVKTCEANNINAFNYLNWIQVNWIEVKKAPASYMPWSYVSYMNDMNNTELIAA